MVPQVGVWVQKITYIVRAASRAGIYMASYIKFEKYILLFYQTFVFDEIKDVLIFENKNYRVYIL